VFYTDEVETHALSGVQLDIGGRLRIDLRPVRLRQVDAAVDPRPAGYAERRPLLAERHAVEELDHSQRAQIRNREIGFIFQAFNLIGDLTVFENVELPLTYRTG
jgi:putative ABC transport system ATP-binding protein